MSRFEWRLSEPATVGSVDLADIQSLSDALPATVYNGCRPLTPGDFLTKFDEWDEAREPMGILARAAIDAASQVMPLKAIGFTLLKETLEPHKGGSNPSAWHAGDEPALLLSSNPTTEFAVGAVEVPKGTKSADLVNSAASIIPEEPELERDGAEVFRPKPGEFTLLSETDVHRAPRNRTESPIDRLFIKFDVVPRKRLVVARHRLIRRVA